MNTFGGSKISDAEREFNEFIQRCQSIIENEDYSIIGKMKSLKKFMEDNKENYEDIKTIISDIENILKISFITDNEVLLLVEKYLKFAWYR